jgi:SHS2 domain-containing protein
LNSGRVFKDYTIIDHTADIGIVVRAKTLKELFRKSAMAFYDITADLNGIKAGRMVPLNIKGTGIEDLMINWLSELLFLFSTENWLSRNVDIVKIDEKMLKAELFGEIFDPCRHRIYTEIKAVTYHKFQVEKKGGWWAARVIFDI